MAIAHRRCYLRFTIYVAVYSSPAPVRTKPDPIRVPARYRRAMRTRVPLLLLTAVIASQSLAPAVAARAEPGARGILIEARNLAYDANYRNDQAGLKAAIAAIQPLATSKDVAAYANYYLCWTYWSLSGSQFQAGDVKSALESGKLAEQHGRAGLTLRPKDPEFQAILANALITVMILDRPRFEKVFPEVKGLRRSALDFAPANPRVILLDAGMIFNDPAEERGKERALARWLEMLPLFDAEAAERSVDPLVPRWGHALAYGWLSSLYLRMTPPQKTEARAA